MPIVTLVFALSSGALIWLLLSRRSVLRTDRDRLHRAVRTSRRGESGFERVVGSRVDPDIKRALAQFEISERSYVWAWVVSGAILAIAGIVVKGANMFVGAALVVAGVFGLPWVVRAAAAARRMWLLRDLPLFLMLLDMYLTRMPLQEAVRAIVPTLPDGKWRGMLRREVIRLVAELEEFPPTEALGRFRDRLGVPEVDPALDALIRFQSEGSTANVLTTQGAKLDDLAEAKALARSKAMPYILVGGQALVMIASFLTFALPFFSLVTRGIQSF